jgi:Family of unknown function (DUF5947)
MHPADDFTEFDDRIEALTRALDASSDVGARASARELVGLVLQFHAKALRRLMDMLSDAPLSVRHRIAADPAIVALLALHELELFPSGRSLLQITRKPEAPAATSVPSYAHAGPTSACERCGADITESHHHFVDIVSRRLSCACRACWLLSGAHEVRGSLRAVPDRYVAGPALRLSGAHWDALQIPVATVFFMFNSTIGRMIAFYPSPGGATESALSLEAWRDVEQANPWVRAAAPDIEALLVRRHTDVDERGDAFIVPIDACYELVGRIRVCWSGFDGGDAVREEINRFFDAVSARSGVDAESMAGRQ